MNTLLKTITLTNGLYKISASGAGLTQVQSAVPTPALMIAPVVRSEQVSATFLGRTRDFALLTAEDGVTILHVHLSAVDFCIFSVTEGAQEPLDLRIDTLAMKSESAPAAVAPEPEPAKAPPAPSLDGVDHILMHLSGMGDARHTVENDLPAPEKPTGVEGFSLHFVSADIPEAALEYKALAINGAETPWVKNGGYCGSRGHGVPLIGLAMRTLSAELECEYRVRFASGALSAVVKSGMPLKSAVAADPIVGISVRLARRASAPQLAAAKPASTKATAPSKGATAAVKKAPPAKAATPSKSSKAPVRKKTR